MNEVIQMKAEQLALKDGQDEGQYYNYLTEATEAIKNSTHEDAAAFIASIPRKENSNTILEVEHVNIGNIKLKEEIKFVAFYADIPHNKINEVIEDIKTWYEDTKTYLIGLEYKEAREHYHFVIDFTDIEYAAYVKRVLKGKYHLSGRRNKKGHTGGYGKVSKIRNLDAMCSYTIKDLDYYTNFKPERIKTLLEASYPKPENDSKEFMQECMEYVKTKDIVDEEDAEWAYPHLIGMYVIDFMREKKRDLLPSTIRRFTLRYLTYHSAGNRGINTSVLFRIMFPHGI